jgi:hypothetical protein
MAGMVLIDVYGTSMFQRQRLTFVQLQAQARPLGWEVLMGITFLIRAVDRQGRRTRSVWI